MNRITKVTRRDIFDILSNGIDVENYITSTHYRYDYCGRLSIIEFLNRLYPLKSMPSKDPRYENAEKDIYIHTVVNPNDYDIDRIRYIIYKDEARRCISGIWFVNGESSHFNIKDKIRKLDEIIDNIINKLNDIPIKENRENLIKIIKDKKGMLANLLKQYNDIEKDYIEYFKYHRKELFEFYAVEYENT